MSAGDLGWRADGIDRARACGGVELSIYRRPGFRGGRAVRRVSGDVSGGSSGMSLDQEVEFEYDPMPDDRQRRKR